jgi:hypothetical protein
MTLLLSVSGAQSGAVETRISRGMRPRHGDKEVDLWALVEICPKGYVKNTRNSFYCFF